MTIKIKTIYRYPIKSMGGHTIESADLTENGIPGDRAWTLRDEERGGIKGGKRFPALMGMSARFRAEPSQSTPSPEAMITLGNQQLISTSDPEVNATLTKAVGSPVTLWPLIPKEQLDHYRRSPPDPNVDMETSLRETFARTPDEPLPDLSVFPKELFQYESPPGTYFDAYPLLVMSEASIQSMADSAPANFDVRRFRPNILVSTDGDNEAFPEETWVGREATLGSARIRFEIACPRCVMTTHGFADLPKDPGIMRALVKRNQGNLGVYASVVEAGSISRDDEVILL